ncbi:MAG TPA: alpha/beta hydrolase [Polyangiaceae bacterium]|nr:alpha/beta hydrolase [Polyangiaceae bacterium]
MKTAEASIEIQQYFLETRDGVTLRYFDADSARNDDSVPPPALLWANGLGGPVIAFEPYLDRLGARYRTLSWDYRGLYGSSNLGPAPRPLSVEAHVEDAIAVLDRAGVERVIFVGWSMGAQIGLELARRYPERLAGLVLVSGAAGRPLEGLALPLPTSLLDRMVRNAGLVAPLGQGVLSAASRFGGTARWLKRMGLVAREFDEGLLTRMLGHFETIDLRRYMELLEGLCEHDARDALEQLTVPTLVIAGSRDVITPAKRARAMAERIRGAEFWLLERATHYAAAEFPAAIAARIDSFVRARVLPGPA